VSVVPGLGSLEPVPLKLTVSGTAPEVGFAVAAAVGAWLEFGPWMRRIVPPFMST
jgi:hypothetical protein